MAEPEKPETPENQDQPKIPPKLVLKPENDTGEPSGGAASTEPPKTVRLKPSQKPVTNTGSKRETTKIPLADAKPAEAESQPGTIRLKPSPAAPADASPPAAPASSAEKRRTAKISLEAALGSEDEEAPRTIRLKRPSEASTARVGEAGRPKSPGAAESKPAGEPSETRKKTIRVKRPTASAGVEVEAEVQRPEFAAAGGPDRPNWFFLLSSIAAVLVSGVLVYCLTAQVFGPDLSGTRLSYGAPTLRLSWPGRVLPGP